MISIAGTGVTQLVGPLVRGPLCAVVAVDPVAALASGGVVVSTSAAAMIAARSSDCGEPMLGRLSRRWNSRRRRSNAKRVIRSMQPRRARPSHGWETLLWTTLLTPQGSDVRVRRPSTGKGGRVDQNDCDSAPRDRDAPIGSALAAPNDPQRSTHESKRGCGPVGRLGEGSVSIGNGLPNRDRLKPSRSVSSDYAYPNSSPSHGAGSRQVCLWGGRTGYQESTENVIDASSDRIDANPRRGRSGARVT